MRDKRFGGRGVLLIAALAVCIATGARADFDDATYPPATLASIVASHVHQLDSDMNFEMASIKQAVDVTWTGAMRKLTPDERLFLTRWGKAWQLDASVPDMYRRAIEVTEGGATYWLAMQQPLVPGLRRDARSGSRVKAYVMLAGDMRGAPVILVNAFTVAGPESVAPQ